MYGLLINRRKVKSTNKINCRCLGGMLFGQGFDSPHLHQINEVTDMQEYSFFY